MFVKIYGRVGCPYCVRAKALAEKLKNSVADFNYEYIDMHEKGLTKDDLSVLVGKTVQTVPQVLLYLNNPGICRDFIYWINSTNLPVGR